MSADHDLNDIEERAADWIVERDRGFTPEREREFLLWLRFDARHAAVFDALAVTWELLDKTAPARIATARSMDSHLRWKKVAWFPLTLAAAAAIVIGAVSWRRMADAKAGGGAMQFALTTATEVGKLRKVDLPDGSVIQLNTDSAVDVRFNPSERRVRLTRGEAHFTVAKNRARPFVVSAAGVDVRVVGTIFNVRLRSESVDVLVTEGKVRVDSLATAPAEESTPASNAASLSELTAGQKVSIALAATTTPAVVAPVEVSNAEIRQTLAWQTQRLDFDATPMSDIVAEINRYNRHKLIVTDPNLSTQRFGGSFPASDFDTLVRMLEADFGVVAERKGDVTILRLKGGSQTAVNGDAKSSPR